MIPAPFTDVVFLYGEPLIVPRCAAAPEWEAQAQRVTLALNDLEARAQVWLKENP